MIGVFPGLLVLAGFSALLLGIGWLSRPAALIVGGLWLIVAGVGYLRGVTQSAPDDR